jgi:hypothetical protein
MTVDTFEGGKYVRTSDYDHLQCELAEAREALRVYGRHLDCCGDADAYNHAEIPSCGCGFDAAMAADSASAGATADDPDAEPECPRHPKPCDGSCADCIAYSAPQVTVTVSAAEGER